MSRQLSSAIDIAAAFAGFGANMFGGDFVFCVDRDFAKRCAVPTLVLPGDDVPHPAVTGRELAEILPGTEYLQDWKSPAHIDVQHERVAAFLAQHAP